eukprot:gene14295-20273_t
MVSAVSLCTLLPQRMACPPEDWWLYACRGYEYAEVGLPVCVLGLAVNESGTATRGVSVSTMSAIGPRGCRCRGHFLPRWAWPPKRRAGWMPVLDMLKVGLAPCDLNTAMAQAEIGETLSVRFVVYGDAWPPKAVGAPRPTTAHPTTPPPRAPANATADCGNPTLRLSCGLQKPHGAWPRPQIALSASHVTHIFQQSSPAAPTHPAQHQDQHPQHHDPRSQPQAPRHSISGRSPRHPQQQTHKHPSNRTRAPHQHTQQLVTSIPASSHSRSTTSTLAAASPSIPAPEPSAAGNRVPPSTYWTTARDGKTLT